MFVDYIDYIIKQGKCYFTIEEASKDLGKTPSAIRSAIAHLQTKSKLARPVYGFYIIVPPEFRDIGCIPPEQFLPYLMQYLEYDYYVALLTAASYYGSSHQSPHIYQVIINKKRPPILTCGKVEIRFTTKQDFSDTMIQKRSNSKSFINISSPESTAFDLLTYSKSSGGLNHIITVLTELQEVINPKLLGEVAKKHSNAPCKQRLGYLLEQIGRIDLAKVLEEDLANHGYVRYTALMPEKIISNKETKNSKWMIIENTKVESDI